MKVIILTVCLSALTITGFAQYKQDFKSFGDRDFNNKDYYEAAYYYKKAAEGIHLTAKLEVPFQGTEKKAKNTKAPDILYISYRLAESYRLYQNYLEAEPWYYKVQHAHSNLYPLTRLWYGVCLRANQHFDEAIVQLTQFIAEYKGHDNYLATAQKEIANCNFAKQQYSYPRLMEVNKLHGQWNSDGSDYSLVQRDSTMYFTSSRIANDDKKHINRIYKTTATAAKPEMVTIKYNEEKKESEYGTPVLSPDGKRMYFTMWYKEGRTTNYAIYFAKWKDEKWGMAKRLNTNVNVDGFNAIQPFITADGKQLFFASNKPGGQGGDDIWVSDLGNDGDAVNSINLGSQVNTAMDEQAPYYNVAQQTLIYSSKGLLGLGGFDFFTSTKTAGAWSVPRNMGYPMNSAKDDLYFSPDAADHDKSFISSDRQSDCCLNLFEVQNKSFSLTGVVNDCDAHTPLAGVRVTLVDSLEKLVLNEVITDARGKYKLTITTKRPYNIVLKKEGYFTKVLPVPFTGNMKGDTLYNDDICLQAFKKNTAIVINNVHYDYNSAKLRPESKIVLNSLVKIMKDNPKIIIELSSHTDSIGGDKYNLELSQRRAQSCVDYIIASGIKEETIFAKGYGKRRPIAPNSLPNGKDNPVGRQLNRRTEFTVIKSE